MRLAVIADIHGNSAALKAVLADIAAFDVSLIVNLGDHFSGPLDAAGTADLLLAQDMLSLRGNHDRFLIETPPEKMGPSDRAAFAQLSPAHLDWLRARPPVLELECGVMACHGTPRSDMDYWLERVDSDGTARMARLEEIAAEVEGRDAELFLCAHTHLARFVRLPDGRAVLNPGSVGCPAYTDDLPVPHKMQAGSPEASYAVIERGARGWEASFRRIPYDSAAMIARARAGGRPEWAQALATGWIG